MRERVLLVKLWCTGTKQITIKSSMRSDRIISKWKINNDITYLFEVCYLASTQNLGKVDAECFVFS
jgi:hypothetical protein